MFVDELAKRLILQESCCVVPVSFNGYTIASQDLPVAARVLYSAFSSSMVATDWMKFSNNVPNIRNLELDTVLWAIMHETNADRIIICVDEISKATNPYDVLTHLVSNLDEFRKPDDSKNITRLGVFITSLDGLLGENFTKSGRLTNC